MDWYAKSDTAIHKELGHFIKQTRLKQNKTQSQVSQEAAISRSTLSQIENGIGGTLVSFIQILRVLNQLHLFSYFQVQSQISPLQLAKLEQGMRERAHTKGKKNQKPESDW